MGEQELRRLERDRELEKRLQQIPGITQRDIDNLIERQTKNVERVLSAMNTIAEEIEKVDTPELREAYREGGSIKPSDLNWMKRKKNGS